MNQCLQDWPEYVEEKRSRCYQLNYYTTEQLVLLRHQLAEFLKNRATLPAQILVLLSAVKSNCSEDDVHAAMKATARNNRFGSIDEDVAAEQAEAAKREKSNEIVKQLMQEYGMQEQTSWAAIQELGCDEDMQVTDYMEWCVANAENENRIEELTSGMQWRGTEQVDGNNSSDDELSMSGFPNLGQTSQELRSHLVTDIAERYVVSCVLTTDIHGRFQNLCHFYPGMGLKLEIFKFFSIVKITVVRQVRMSPASTVVLAWR